MRLVASLIAVVLVVFVFTHEAILPVLGGVWSYSKECSTIVLSYFTDRTPLVSLEENPTPQVVLQDSFPNTAATCTQPQVRKEWRSMADSEKEAWINAVKCLTTLPCTNSANLKGPFNGLRNESSSWYDDFTYTHMELNDNIHQTGFFFPWHRYFLWTFEVSMRDLCGYNGSTPYWDWTIDAPDFAHASIFNDSDPRKGLGTLGSAAFDGAVLDGAFANMPLAYPSPHILRRQYTPQPYKTWSTVWTPNPDVFAATKFTQEEVQKMVQGFVGDFKGFQAYLEGTDGAHMSAHLIVGGDLGGTCMHNDTACLPDAKSSPNEPVFWLHHAMVDKVWYDWQRSHAENYWTLDGGVNRALETWPRFVNGAPPELTMDYPLPTKNIMFGNFSVGHFFNSTAGTPLCYVYE